MRRFIFSSCATAMVLSPSVFAQDAMGIDLGGFELIPTAKMRFVHTDNLLYSDQEGVESSGLVVTPSLVLLNEYETSRVQLGYRLQRANYFSSQDDNYTDHYLNFLVDHEFNSKNKVVVDLFLEDGHDARGTRFSIGSGETLSTPDTYKNSSIDVTYTYGSLTSPARLDINLGRVGVDYDINSDEYRVRDRVGNVIGGVFYYAVGAATDLTLDYQFSDVIYDFSSTGNSSLDSTENKVLLGVKWDSTSKTSGKAKIGYREKNFSSAVREDFSGVDWEVKVNWQPQQNSTITVTTASNTFETNGDGDFIKSRTYSAYWKHNWLERFSSEVVLSFDTDEYIGAVVPRDDENMSTQLKLNYEARRWLVLGFEYKYSERDSTVNSIDYDQNSITLIASVSL